MKRLLWIVAVLGMGSPVAAQELDASEVVRRVQAHNPEVARSRIAIRQAQATLRSEDALLAPVFSSGATYVHSDEPTQGLFENGLRISDTLQLQAQLTRRLRWGTDLTLAWQASRLQIVQPFQLPGGGRDVNTIGPNWDERLTFTLRQPLLRGFGAELNTLNVQSAAVQLDQAEVEERRQAAAALLDALTRYTELVYASRDLALRGRQRELLLQQRDATAALVEAGRVAATELDVLDQRLLTLEEGQLAAQQEQRRLARALLLLLGEPAPPAAPTLTALELPALPPLPLDAEALTQAAWESSPELRSLDAQLEGQRLQLVEARDATLPQLDLTATVGQRGLSSDGLLDATEQVLGLKAGVASAGVTLQIPLDNDRAEQRLTATRIAVEGLEQRRDTLRRQLAAQVRDALDAALTQQRRREITARAADLASRNLDAERARFLAGRSTNQAVLSFQADLEAAQLRQLRAEVDEVLAMLQLLYITNRIMDI